MALQEGVDTKFDVYTLACRQLLSRLQRLHAVTQTDVRLTYDTCLQRSDRALHVFFEGSSANNVEQAAEQYASLLGAQADLFRDSNGEAAAVFDDTVSGVKEQASVWDYQMDLDELHGLGRDLARRFFGDSPWRVTQERLNRRCETVVEYLGLSEEVRPGKFAYRPNYRSDEPDEDCFDAILVRFAFSDGIAAYLAYPFLFLHEYTAHVFAIDYGNERFNDGWMLHAAAAFLTREWNRLPKELNLNWQQAGMFYEFLLETLRENPIPWRACQFSRHFDAWLSAELPEKFKEITYELSAFQPVSGEKDYWPNQFINSLERESIDHPEGLLNKIQSTRNARELMTTLAPV